MKLRRTTPEDEEYEDAVAALAALANREPLLDFQYPEALRHAQRDVYGLLRRDASESNSAFSTATTMSSSLTARTTASTMTTTFSATWESSSSSPSTWTTTSATSSWTIPSWCTPILPVSTGTTSEPWTMTTTVASTKNAVNTRQSWLDWTTTTMLTGNDAKTTASGANPAWHDSTATSTTKRKNNPSSTNQADSTWADWSASKAKGSADPTWSDWAVSTTTKTPADPTWSDWAATVTEPTSSGWDPLKTTATDHTWSASTSVKPKTNSGDIVSSDDDMVTTSAANPSWTDQNDPGVSTGSWEQTTTAAAQTDTVTISLTPVKPSTSSPTTSADPVNPWQTYTGAARQNSASVVSIVAAIIVLASFLEF